MIGNTEKFCKTFELYSVKTEFGLITNKQPKAVHVVVTSSLKVIIISSVTWKSKLSKKRKLHILEAFICLLIVRVYLTSVLSFFRGEIKKVSRRANNVCILKLPINNIFLSRTSPPTQKKISKIQKWTSTWRRKKGQLTTNVLVHPLTTIVTQNGGR